MTSTDVCAYEVVRPGPAPRRGGGHFGAVPPQITTCDPQARIVSKEINRLGATGVQFKA